MGVSGKVAVREEVTIALVAALAHHGFELSKGFLTAQLQPDFEGFVGLNFVMFRKDGVVELNPIMGIICQPLESALVAFTDWEERRPSPSLTSSLGYLMPERSYLGWLFDPNKSVEERFAEVTRLTEAIETWGLRFMRENCSMQAVINCLEINKYSSVQRAEYHLPVAYQLSGDLAKAWGFVTDRVAEMNSRTDDAANLYRRFAENVFPEKAPGNAPSQS